MVSLVDYGHIGMDNGTKVHHFLQEIKSSEFEAAVNIVQAQPEKYGKDFDMTVSSLGQIVMKKGYIMQSLHITKTVIQPAKTKVASVRSSPRKSGI